MVGVNQESLFVSGSDVNTEIDNTEVNKAEIEKQYNLFSSNGDFIYNAADIKMSDKGLGDLITKGSIL